MNKIDKHRLIIFTIIGLMVVAIVSIVVYFFCMPKLEIGTESVKMRINDDLLKPNYKATIAGKDASNDVTISNNVDATKVGTYEIVYDLKVGLYNIKKKTIVEVVDDEAPVITLNGDVMINTCELKLYTEEGFYAKDNYDGDVTSRVTTRIEDDGLFYEVSDSSGNKGVAKRVFVGDNEKPEIILNGPNTIYLKLNDNYVEQGAKANDNCDGDLTEKIEISGSVDSSKIGTYDIIYQVKDKKGNEARASRKVMVYDGNSSADGIIYLTFDDGPGAYTTQILDTLAKYNIKATFFVTNGGSDDVLLREYQDGHTIGLHTATHQWYNYESVDSYFNDLNIVRDRVKRVTGLDAKFIRFPGGSGNTISKKYNRGIMTTLTQEVQNRGYVYFDWNEAVEDAGTCARRGISDRTNCVYGYFIRGLSKNKINLVLLHDVKSYTANALEEMINYALANGYTFKNIDEATIPIHQGVAN